LIGLAALDCLIGIAGPGALGMSPCLSVQPGRDRRASTESQGMARILTVAAAKGGVGKTTTVANLAAAVGEAGGRALAIDLDGSAFSLTRSFGQIPSRARAGTFELMTGTTTVADAVVADVVPGVDLLVARRELAALELQLVAELGRELILRGALAGQVEGYDVVIIDTAPGLTLLTVNAVYAAEGVIIPLSLEDAGSVQGALEMAAAVDRARDRGATARIKAVVRVKVDTRRVAAQAIDATLSEHGLPVAREAVPLLAAFQTATACGVPLLVSHPDNRGSCSYWRVAQELGLTSRVRAAA
jgi:chromosome partitioning protein